MGQIGAGTLLAGKYRIESLLGRGGMGSVWRAEHLALRAPVAVKLLDLVDLTGAAEALNRFHREAHAAAAIRSPHVVQIFDHGVDEALAVPFIVMELMEGESLANRLTRYGHIGPADAARVFTHVARALSRAHEAGIVHRDLKPDNVFLVRNEEEEIAKVLDFGIAKGQVHGLDTDSATRTGTVMGTAYYMSPEQISGAKTVDFRTDLWAFGVMACECLTGVRPFDADSIGGLTLRICVDPIPQPSSFAPVPVGFDEWFARIVNRDPALRFGSARDAADALRVLCTGESGVRHSPQPPPPSVIDTGTAYLGTAAPVSRSAEDWASTPPWRRSKVLSLTVGGIAVATLAGAFWLWHSGASHAANRSPLPSATAPASAEASSALALPPVCEPNASQCVGTTPQACLAGQWLTGSVASGQCGAECTPGASAPRCNGPTPQSCDPTGRWQGGTACNKSETCRAGACVAQKQFAPARQATPHTRPPKPDCDPPYQLDAQGQKHFKPECYPSQR